MLDASVNGEANVVDAREHCIYKTHDSLYLSNINHYHSPTPEHGIIVEHTDRPKENEEKNFNK